jgi:HEPN domain-containing protein
MPPDEKIPGTALEGLRRAKGDLAMARIPLPEGASLEDLCYHARQAAEKAQKAVSLRHGWTFRYTHDPAGLTVGLVRRGIPVPASVVEADVLSGYATKSRYPGVGGPVTLGEYREALCMAEAVVAWAVEKTDK